MCKLSDDDGLAVDIYLASRVRHDESPTNGNGNGGGESHPVTAPEDIQKRFAGVERIFGLLQHLPAPEPPGDLVAKSLQAIEAIHVGALPELDDKAQGAYPA